MRVVLRLVTAAIAVGKRVGGRPTHLSGQTNLCQTPQDVLGIDRENGLLVAAAMDTIDATPVAKWLDRHNHHLTRGSQADVELVLGGIPPADRPTLRAREGPSGRYWEIIKAE